MKMIFSAIGAVVIAASFATPAAASPIVVEPGDYLFQTADGAQQKFTVSIDTNGDTAVTSLGISSNEPCKISGTEQATTLNADWGFGGDYVIGGPNMTSGKVSISATDSYFVFDVNLSFGNNGTATGGLIMSYGATLYPTGPVPAHPTHALFCVAPYQAMTFVSFTPPTGDAHPVSATHTAKAVKSVE